MTFFKNLIWLFIIPIFAFGIHKHYISLTKIDFVEEKKTIQITMRFFIDDIATVIENSNEIPMKLGSKNEHKNADQYLENYIHQKFKITINNIEKPYQYLGKEYENDLVYFYLEITGIESIKSIEVQNKMLFEDFYEQQNYIKLNIGDLHKTFILVKTNDKKLLKL